MRGMRRQIRVRGLLFIVAACAFVCGSGVALYRAWSPVRRLASQLRPGNSQFVRREAVLRLGNEVPNWERDEAFRLLVPVLNDPDPLLRASAAGILASNRAQAARIVPLLTRLLSDNNAMVRESALFGLEQVVLPGTSHAEALTPLIAPMLDDSNAGVRMEAVRALVVTGSGQLAVPKLVQAVRDKAGIERNAAIGWLVQMQTVPAEIEPTLHQMIRSGTVWERVWAADALLPRGRADLALTVWRDVIENHPDRSVRLRVAAMFESATKKPVLLKTLIED